MWLFSMSQSHLHHFPNTAITVTIDIIVTSASHVNFIHSLWGLRWKSTTTEELLPGDVFSLRRSKRNDIVPCDCLLIRGSAVLNEATLTGESVPQMKEGLAMSKDGGDEVCDLYDTTASASVVFSVFVGTCLVLLSAVLVVKCVCHSPFDFPAYCRTA